MLVIPYGLLALLFLISLAGLLLLAYKKHTAMGCMLAKHLGLVFGFFLDFPYCKFVHAIYRYGVLIQFEQKAD